MKNFFGLFKGTGRIIVAAATCLAEQINRRTPVDFQVRAETGLTLPEINSLLKRLGVNEGCHDQMEWFGDVYGRYYFLISPLLERWKSRRQANQTGALAESFFSAETVEDPSNARHLPALDKEFKQLLLKVWKGTATNDDSAKFVPYGILKKNKAWSCEYVRRKLF